jgi:hypothetical protein
MIRLLDHEPAMGINKPASIGDRSCPTQIDE